jgi:hypothetical protein
MEVNPDGQLLQEQSVAIAALTYAIEVSIKRINRDVLPQTRGPRRDYLASISNDLADVAAKFRSLSADRP